MESRLDRKTIGFNAEIAEKNTREMGELLAQVTPTDLVKYGLIPEFVGRVPVMVSLQGLDKEAMIRILTEPKNAQIKQYQKLFSFDDVKLVFEPDAVEEIAEKAMERKTGARGLRSILENVLMDVMYRIPSDDTIEQCIITKEAVDKESAPLVVHRDTGGRLEDMKVAK